MAKVLIVGAGAAGLMAVLGIHLGSYAHIIAAAAGLVVDVVQARRDHLAAALADGGAGEVDAVGAGQQAQAVDQARLRWEALRAEANQLNAAMRAGGGATRRCP